MKWILVLFLQTLIFQSCWLHSLNDMSNCRTDRDCQNLQMCQQEPCECFPFSNDFLGPRCVKFSWAFKIRSRRMAMTRSPDIGPDTCGQDRQTLG